MRAAVTSQHEQIRDEMFAKELRSLHARTDRMFAWLLLAQWAFAVAAALVISPWSWVGDERHLHSHVLLAVFLGGAINLLPLALIGARPAWWGTRQTVAVAQMLWSALLIHLTGGRIETHFHVFGSLAFLAFYRDWTLLPTATITVAIDHLARGVLWPESVYGIANPEWWRFLEHAAWVTFEDLVLFFGCVRGVRELRAAADREAALAVLNSDIGAQVEARTAELRDANASLAAEMKSRLQVEAELRQAQKLESVGRLASGIAHEINTPIQFVSDSIHFLNDATKDLMSLVNSLCAVQQSILDGAPSQEAATAAEAAQQAVDLEFLRERVPQAFDLSLEGLARVSRIVRSMKHFAHPDAVSMTTVDLNAAIESTLVIARTEYKSVADVETEFDTLPLVQCHAGEFNQVILNIIVNAAHAIGDVVAGSTRRGRIAVRTRQDGGDVVVTISDTGGGIPAEIRDKIFDPFFTTKPVGKGTGQGLAIVQAVLAKHRGRVEVESVIGEGTTFHLRLPIEQPSTEAIAA